MPKAAKGAEVLASAGAPAHGQVVLALVSVEVKVSAAVKALAAMAVLANSEAAHGAEWGVALVDQAATAPAARVAIGPLVGKVVLVQGVRPMAQGPLVGKVALAQGVRPMAQGQLGDAAALEDRVRVGQANEEALVETAMVQVEKIVLKWGKAPDRRAGLVPVFAQVQDQDPAPEEDPDQESAPIAAKDARPWADREIAAKGTIDRPVAVLRRARRWHAKSARFNEKAASQLFAEGRPRKIKKRIRNDEGRMRRECPWFA